MFGGQHTTNVPHILVAIRNHPHLVVYVNTLLLLRILGAWAQLGGSSGLAWGHLTRLWASGSSVVWRIQEDLTFRPGALGWPVVLASVCMWVSNVVQASLHDCGRVLEGARGNCKVSGGLAARAHTE